MYIFVEGPLCVLFVGEIAFFRIVVHVWPVGGVAQWTPSKMQGFMLEAHRGLNHSIRRVKCTS